MTKALNDLRVVLATACAVLIASVAGVTVHTFVGRTVTVAGTVLDSRTHNPVSGVAITAEGTPQQRTDAKGAFRVLDVPRKAFVHFAAANYASVTMEASGDPVHLNLHPLPVTGTVTSSFTGKGIAATVAGIQTQKTGAGGTFTTYGVGPGDTLHVTAFGHEPATVKIDATRKVTVALKLGTVDANQVLQPLPASYGYVDAPAELINELRAGIAEGDPEAARHITGVAVKSIIVGGNSIGVITAVAMDPSYAALPGARDGFFEGFTMGSTMHSDHTIGDTQVRKAEGDGAVGFAWQRYSAFIGVIGENAKAIEAITRSLILGETSSA